MADTKYKSELTGPEMDQALIDMNNHVSEAWAVGTRGGQAVQPTDETYHNNAKYYAQLQSTLIAPAYDATSTYAVGDIVSYDNAIYECNTAITTAEAFNPSKWDAVDIKDIVDGKQNLVPTATEDNISIFNGSGQVKDGGKKLSDFNPSVALSVDNGLLCITYDE